MNYRCILCFLLLQAPLVAANPFLQDDGSLSAPLIELLNQGGLYEPGDTLDSAVEKTQKKWLQVVQGQGNRERTDLTDTEEMLQTKDKVIAIARKMGLFDGHSPTRTHYTYAAWLGSFLETSRQTLTQLYHIQRQRVTFDQLVVLTGERYLRKGQGEAEAVAKLSDPTLSPLPFNPSWKFEGPYETEYDMMQHVFSQNAWDGIPPVTFVNAPRGQAARPSTRTTYHHWFEQHNPEPGTILALSLPLVGHYQQLVAENCMRDGFTVETTFPPVSEQLLDKFSTKVVSLIYDTVAKCLYELKSKKCP